MFDERVFKIEIRTKYPHILVKIRWRLIGCRSMSLHCCVYIAFFKFYGGEIYRFNYMRYHISHSSPYINIRGTQLAYSVIF